MMTCKEVAKKVASQPEDMWTPKQWVAVHIHQWMCPHCRRFVQQMRLIEKGTAQLRTIFDSEARVGNDLETLEQRTLV